MEDYREELEYEAMRELELEEMCAYIQGTLNSPFSLAEDDEDIKVEVPMRLINCLIDTKELGDNFLISEDGQTAYLNARKEISVLIEAGKRFMAGDFFEIKISLKRKSVDFKSLKTYKEFKELQEDDDLPF